MIKKSITAVIIICLTLAAALVFANYTGYNNSTNKSINNNSSPEQQISTTNISNNANAPNKRTSNTSKNQLKISPKEAKKIAQKYIEKPGLTAGTPVLTTKKDGDIYIVPIINNKNKASAGYIAIDAQTGEFMDTGTP